MTSSAKLLQRFFLFGSLAGLLIGVVMSCIPPEQYATIRDPADEWSQRMGWIALIVLSVSGLVTTAVLQTMKLPGDDEGPIIIRR